MAGESIPHKTCARCGVDKPHSDYYITYNNKPFRRCKPCYLAWQAEYRRSKRPLAPTSKECTNCRETKPLYEFSLYWKGGQPSVRSHCASCYFTANDILSTPPEKAQAVGEPSNEYFAGHWDGEGSILMPTAAGRRRPTLVMSLTGAHLATLEAYQRRFGGCIHKPKRWVNRPLYIWQLTKAAACYQFLQAIGPYSIEKRAQVNTALTWLEYRAKYSHSDKSSDVEKMAIHTRDKLRELKVTTYQNQIAVN